MLVYLEMLVYLVYARNYQCVIPAMTHFRSSKRTALLHVQNNRYIEKTGVFPVPVKNKYIYMYSALSLNSKNEFLALMGMFDMYIETQFCLKFGRFN